MAQVCPRPSFAAALCVWRCHLFPYQRTVRFLQPTSFRSISPPPPPPPPPPVFLSSHGLGFSRRSFCFRAATDSGAIDSNLIRSMENKIKEHLAAESVIVMDAYGDGRHVSINVISTAFEGQSAVNRQRMVYKAIWEELQNTVHAVDQMTTRTPAEAAGT